jgi:hypothetical protein
MDSVSNSTPKVVPMDFEKRPLPGDNGSGVLISNPDENILG